MSKSPGKEIPSPDRSLEKAETARFVSQRSTIKEGKRDPGKYLIAIYDMLNEVIAEKQKGLQFL